MSRRMLAIVCCLCVLVATGFAGDPQTTRADNDSSSASRDANSADVKGIRTHHRYAWATVAGTALGAGIGALLPPGSGKSAAKGALIGGGLTSLLYLSSHKNDPTKHRPFAWIVTNAVLAGGVGWAICNCGKGFPIGAAIGGGFTGAVQAFAPRHHPTLTKYTGATPPEEQQPQPQPQPQPQLQAPTPPEPPPPPPPQTQQQIPQPPPPPPPPQDDNVPPDDAQAMPQSGAGNLPDSPQPKIQPDS